MTKTTGLSLLVIVLVTIIFFSFKSNSANKKYQYLTAYGTDDLLGKVVLCIDGKEYKKLPLHSQVQGNWDMNPLINVIHQYENDGWELMNLESGSYPYFYMRKEME